MLHQIPLDESTDHSDALRLAVEQLAAGKVVAVPDEVGTLVLALPHQPQAVTRLARLSSIIEEAIPVVALSHASVIDDLVDNFSAVARKLIRRCWPGPVALRVGRAVSEGITEEWPEVAQRWAMNEAGRAYNVPGQLFAHNLLRHLPGPALGIVIPLSSNEKLTDDLVDLSLTSVESRYAEGLTLIRVEAESIEIEKPGVVSERILSRLSGEVYLFVCTGNTCRSPMAEALFRKMLAERYKCNDDELLDRGFTVVSAGLAAYPGAPANSEAIKLLHEEGIDLTSHESQPVTEELLFHCDHILTMTQNHLDAILGSFPELKGTARLLSETGKSVSDPIGGGREEYKLCRDEIEGYLKTLLDQQAST